MTRLGFYIVHNNRHKLVKIVDVPWSFTTNKPDSENSEASPEEATEILFEDWIMDYFNDVLFNEKDFFNNFNTDRTYIILAQENESIMGFFMVQKGRVYINFNEHDYRVLVNALHPTIREDMVIPDTSFGGYDDDDQFQVDPSQEDDECEDNEHKTLATYPNLIYHLCEGHFDHSHYHKP